MKSLRIISLIMLCASLFVACAGEPARGVEEFSQAIYEPRYATGFDISGAEGAASTLLTVRNPWQGAEGVEKRLFIARDGERAPEGFEGQVIEGAAERVVCMSSTYVAMLDALDCAERVVGVSGIDYIYNTRVREAAEAGRVRDVGHDSDINFELLLTLRPDVVLIYGVAGENGVANAKLDELGIPYFYLGDYVEESPLAKAEWTVVVAESAMERPTVMFNTPYRDTWYMPSSRSYAVQLVADAGGRYIYDGNHGTASQPIDLEQAYVLTREADYWINVGQYATLDDLRRDHPRFADAKAVREGRVYSSDRRSTAAGGSDFWESAVVNPDVVLADLVAVLQPDLGLGADSLTYYRQIE